MSSFAGGSQQGQQAGGYLGGPFVPHDYNARYGMGGVAAMPYGLVPYGLPPPGPVPYGHGLPGDSGYDADALAQGIDNNLMLNPQQQMMGPLPGGQYPPGPYGGGPQQRGGGYNYGYPPPGHGMRGQQQMMQPHMGGPQGHQMLNGNRQYGPGPGNPGRGDGRGGRGGRGGPMQQQDSRQQQPPQQQRRKKVQRGLEDNVRRTVYISYIDQQVTEESLATFFADCGTVMDCRICGDPNSAMRFAFIEFLEEAGAQEALNKTGSILGTSQLRVLPSKTAIVPVNKELMPRSHEELERCSRTVYVANIDKKVEREDVRNFFEQLCGKVGKIRLLGDLAHSTRIAFIEFIQAEAAMAALNCSGALLGSLPLRVSPSKTPVRGDREDKEARQGQRGNRPGSGRGGAAGTAAAAAVAAANAAAAAEGAEQAAAATAEKDGDGEAAAPAEQQQAEDGAAGDGSSGAEGDAAAAADDKESAEAPAAEPEADVAEAEAPAAEAADPAEAEAPQAEGESAAAPEAAEQPAEVAAEQQ